MTPIVGSAKKHCTDLLTNSRCIAFPYHNHHHTLEVYGNVQKIGTHEMIDPDKLEPVLLAALFHDTGMTKSIEDHEDYSLAEATSYLNNVEYDVNRTRIVLDCINATRAEINPATSLEAILCDADLFHLGSKDFFVKNELLRKEWSLLLNLKYTESEWASLNIEFLKGYVYYTKYGREILTPVKLENIRLLQSQKY